MKKIYLYFALFLGLTSVMSAQEWTFDNMDLEGWTPFRLDHSFTSTYVTLSTKGQNNPRFDNASAGIDANTLKYAVVTMRVADGGPTLLRVNYDGGFSTTPIITGTSFQTYYLNMTDPDWSGTENEIELAFREIDGSNGGGTHNSNNRAIDIQKIEFVENIFGNSTELFVDPTNGNDNNIGTTNAPLKTIPYAIEVAAQNSITNVYVKAGTYDIPNGVFITTSAPAPVIVSPESGANVKLNLGNYRNFRFYDGAKNIEIKGFEVNGNSNTTDHWTLLSEYVWEPQTLAEADAGGGIGFQIEDAEDIKITDNIIHDFYQKAVNIEDGRYITVKGNVIYNIGLTSLSGGHGIMRQQGSGSFPDPDISGKYRWDLDGNLLFNVHQRIYSWVPSKGYLNMTLDEGKPILIDETPDHDQNMTARIKDNIVAFSKIDAIRLKPTNGLEVVNNTVFTQDEHADGITNTVNGFSGDEPFRNFICNNNAVQVLAEKKTYDLVEALASTGSSFSNNYSGIGEIDPVNMATDLNTDLFVDPDNGDFSLSDGSLSNVGSSAIGELVNKAASYGITIENDNWEHDHLKNFQTLWDNVPGLEDGIAGNETVFTDAGTYDLSDLEFVRQRKALYFYINSTWQADNIDDLDVLDRGNGLDAYDGRYEIVVPEKYQEWYDDILVNHLRDTDGDGMGDTPYARVRYGASVLAQDKIFQNNSLHVVELEEIDHYTQTEAQGHDVTVDGDLLVDFEYTPQWTQSFDLIIADNITGTFNEVSIEGYSGEYTLEVVDEAPYKILRLTLTSPDCMGVTKTWDGSQWSGIDAPEMNDVAIIDGDYNTGDHGNLDVCELIINDSNTLTVTENTFIKTQNNITVNLNASLIVNHKGSVVQVSENASVTNDGTINVITETLELKPKDFVAFGSPMTEVTREGDLGPINAVFKNVAENFRAYPGITGFNFQDDNFDNHLPHSGTLNPGEGYLVRPRPINATGNEVYTETFTTGTLNSGEIVFDVVYNGSPGDSYNLLANPYASAIDARDFITANSMVNEIFLWEHVISPSTTFPGANTINHSMENISMFNLTGPVTASGATQPNNGYLSTAQGFGILATAAGTATFTNDMRLTDNNNTLRSAEEQNMDRLWLKVSNPTYDYHNTTLIGFTEEATEGVDSGYDSGRMATVVSLFSHLEDGSERFAIQGKSQFTEDAEIKMGFSSIIEEYQLFTISLEKLEGYNIEEYDVYLFDNINGVLTNLSNEEYSFMANSGMQDGRFLVHFISKNVLDVDTSELSSLKIFPNPTTGPVSITSPIRDISTIEVFDVGGRIVKIENVNILTDNHQLDLSNLESALYFVKISTNRGTITHKILKR